MPRVEHFLSNLAFLHQKWKSLSLVPNFLESVHTMLFLGYLVVLLELLFIIIHLADVFKGHDELFAPEIVDL